MKKGFEKISNKITCDGRGGAGLGGGCFAFLGGSAGLGDSGLGGGIDFEPETRRFKLLIQLSNKTWLDECFYFPVPLN